jgi:uncharacterized protein (TIGR02117 family)
VSWRWPLRALGAVAATVLLYWLVAGAAMLVPVNRNFTQAAEGVDIFVMSNGVHVDLVLPVEQADVDWRSRGILTDPDTAYLAFGWGERDFYLTTPRWSDFRLSTAVGALLWQTDVLVHVTRLAGPPQRPDAVRLRVSEPQYRRLAAYVAASLAPSTVLLTGYGKRDDFYEGAGVYTPFFTCNEWANRGLRDAGLPAALWSPLPHGVIGRAAAAR